MFRFSSKPQTILEVLTDGLRLYQATFLKVWIWSFAITAISSIPELNAYLGGEAVHNPKSVSLTTALFLVLLLLLSAFFVTVMMHRIYALGTDDQLTLRDSIDLAWRKWIVIFPAMMVVMLATLLGLTFFIVPGIFISVIWAFYLPLLITESMTAWQSLRASYEMIWGYAWRTLLMLAVPSGLITGFILLATWIMGTEDNVGLLLARVATVTVLTPFLSSVLWVHFQDIKCRRGGVKSKGL